MVPLQPLRKMLQSESSVAQETRSSRGRVGGRNSKGRDKVLAGIGDAGAETDTEERPRPLR